MQPTRKPTTGEYGVIAVILIAFAIGFGLVCVYCGYAKSEKNPENAEIFRIAGFMLLAAGILGPIIGKFVIRNLFD